MDFAVVFPQASELLNSLVEKTEGLNEKLAASQSKVEELEKSLEEKTSEATQLQDQLKERDAAIDELKERIQKMEERDYEGILAKLSSAETDLPKALEEVQHFREEMGKHCEKLATVTNTAEASQQRAETAATAAEASARSVERIQQLVEDQGKAMKKMKDEVDGACAMVTDLSESMSGKYAKLWKEVEGALKKLHSSELFEVRRQLDRQLEDRKNEAQQMAAHALTLVARAQRVANEQAQRRETLTLWRHEAARAQNRHMACRMLVSTVNDRLREALCGRWRAKTAMRVAMSSAVDQCKQLVPDVPALIQASELAARVNALSGDVESLHSTAATKDELEAAQSELSEKLMVLEQGDLARVVQECSDVAARMASTEELSSELRERVTEAGSHLAALQDGLVAVEEHMEDFARSTEVKGMLKDVLLMWNAIKQLDAAKADKQFVDQQAMEADSREAARMEKWAGENTTRIANAVRDASVAVQRCDTLAQSVSEGQERFTKLQEMLNAMASGVQELVDKVSALDGVHGGGRARTIERPQTAPLQHQAAVPRFQAPERAPQAPIRVDGRGAGGAARSGALPAVRR